MRNASLSVLSLLVLTIGACSTNGGTADGGGGDGAVGPEVEASVEDDCHGVTGNGRCISETQLERCVETSENPLEVLQETCEPYEECKLVDDVATCVLKAGKCATGETRCDSATVLATCGSEGAWSTETCSGGCKATAAGAYCDPGIATIAKSYQFQYEARDIDEDTMNRWGDIFLLPAAGLQVVSRRGSSTIDTKVTDSTGAVTINVPSAVQAGDSLTLVAIRASASNPAAISLALANPKLTDGAHSTRDVESATASIYWSWAWDLTGEIATPAIITVDKDSGALRAFDTIRQLLEIAEGQFKNKASKPMVIWMQPNVTWSCGVCHGMWGANVGPVEFERQLWIPMDIQNEAYWSTAVLGHEFGHYVMGMWGTSPREAGQHCFSRHYPPGLSWSEGWATWYSAEWRRPTGMGNIYYSKQRGSFSTFDINDRTYSSGYAWVRPTVAAGLLQNIDENEVSAMSWTLSGSSLGSTPMYNALASTRMNTSPFGRNYTRRKWAIDNKCRPINITDAGVSAPMFADFLDALTCAGAAASLIDTATEPAEFFPYPSTSPACP